MQLDEIKSPKDIFEYMLEHIEYGWIDINNNKHINTMKDFRKIYRIASLEETIENGIGTCIEQVVLMHFLFGKLNIKNKMFCCRIYEPDNHGDLEEEEHMHCFLLYHLNNKVYHMEHPHFKKKGIYEYASEAEAISTIVKYYKELRGGKDSPTTEFYEAKPGLSFGEFNNYINHVNEHINIASRGISLNKRTIMIFPQFENIKVINDMRKKYDPLADLVRPHITLVFPFESNITNEELSLYLKESLINIKPFKIELKGFSKQEDRYGNYLFFKVVHGIEELKNIHDILYKDKLKQFNKGYKYIPHITVGKMPSVELLNEAFRDVNTCKDKFSTIVKKISVEMIGNNEESIIVIEHILEGKNDN